MAESTYDPKAIEAHWQAWWDANGTNRTDLAGAKNPFYVLMMFPYPSAEGLHVGNVFAFTGADIQGRYRRLRGYDVFEPLGFDAFGIHSENFAMKIGRHPSELIPANIANFTRQLKMMGLMTDWEKSVDTTTPEYYKWTQWVFLQLFKAGLAYRDTKEVNFCPDCGTVISDEQVIDGKCERHPETEVQRRAMPCWFFRITKFADRLEKNLDKIDWSDRTKLAQKNWIGRSEGAEIDFQVAGSDAKIRVFTTRPDTLFGATFMVLAPDHPIVDAIATAAQKPAIAAYRDSLKRVESGTGSERGTGVPPVLEGLRGVSPLSLGEGYGHILSDDPEINRKRGANLPHWRLEGGAYSITFRLADSLPSKKLEEYRATRSRIVEAASAAGRELNQDELRTLAFLFSEKIEDQLDTGEGACLLRDGTNAEIVANALKHFDGSRYRLFAWCVMPNHVHVLMQPLGEHKLADILHSWKSFTSKEILKRSGGSSSQVWQAEYFDHLIRHEGSLRAAAEYIWHNPEKARLGEWKWRWRIDGESQGRQGQDAPATFEHGRDARATMSAAPQKTGVFTGAHAINPATSERIPIWIADYVLMGYGTGAIMAVPSGDHRDFAFAEKFGLPVRGIIDPEVGADWLDHVSSLETIPTDDAPDAIRAWVSAGRASWSGPGRISNSRNADISLDGLAKEAAIEAMIPWLEKKGIGTRRTTFRLRDWGISRQRYWGPPIPIIYDEDGTPHAVPEDQLPVALPPTKDFRPKGDGRGPLANIPDFVNATLPDGRPGRRETDVMDNFLDSAWYFIRYLSARDSKQAWDPALVEKWLPVDMYIGGNEHAVLHLLYVRFLCMALEEAGALKMGARADMPDRAEPFRQFRAHGLLVREGAKMSKSKGNVVNPDALAEEHGADTLRMYLMFLGPYLQGGDFRDSDIMGIRRFLSRVHAWYADSPQEAVPDEQLPRPVRAKLHKTIRKVGADIEALSYNTAIAALMELHNEVKSAPNVSVFLCESFIVMLAPFAPHLAEEVWHTFLKHKGSVFDARWPAFDPALCIDDEVELAVQVNSKVRGRVVVPNGADEATIRAAAIADPAVAKGLEGKEIVRVVLVAGRLVNFIVK